uniref:Tudor domain-containing protein n=1 Tax=Macrostomum lignano TaxID=282301 RepID=A0A1I8GV51_9PLAT
YGIPAKLIQAGDLPDRAQCRVPFGLLDWPDYNLNENLSAIVTGLLNEKPKKSNREFIMSVSVACPPSDELFLLDWKPYTIAADSSSTAADRVAPDTADAVAASANKWNDYVQEVELFMELSFEDRLLRDLIVLKSTSKPLRTLLLKESSDLTLKKAVEISKNFEATNTQAKDIEKPTNEARNTVSKINNRPTSNLQFKQTGKRTSTPNTNKCDRMFEQPEQQSGNDESNGEEINTVAMTESKDSAGTRTKVKINGIESTVLIDSRSSASLITGIRKGKTSKNSANESNRTKLPQMNDQTMYPLVKQKDKGADYKRKMSNYANRNARDCDIKTGDSVVIEREARNKHDSFFGTEQYYVRKRVGGLLILENKSGTIKKRHVNKARKIFPDSKSDEALVTFSGGGGMSDSQREKRDASEIPQSDPRTMRRTPPAALTQYQLPSRPACGSPLAGVRARDLAWPIPSQLPPPAPGLPQSGSKRQQRCSNSLTCSCSSARVLVSSARVVSAASAFASTLSASASVAFNRRDSSSRRRLDSSRRFLASLSLISSSSTVASLSIVRIAHLLIARLLSGVSLSLGELSLILSINQLLLRLGQPPGGRIDLSLQHRHPPLLVLSLRVQRLAFRSFLLITLASFFAANFAPGSIPPEPPVLIIVVVVMAMIVYVVMAMAGVAAAEKVQISHLVGAGHRPAGPAAGAARHAATFGCVPFLLASCHPLPVLRSQPRSLHLSQDPQLLPANLLTGRHGGQQRQMTLKSLRHSTSGQKVEDVSEDCVPRSGLIRDSQQSHEVLHSDNVSLISHSMLQPHQFVLQHEIIVLSVAHQLGRLSSASVSARIVPLPVTYFTRQPVSRPTDQTQ